MGVSNRARRRPQLDAAAFASLGPGQLRGGRDADTLDGVTPAAVLTARSLEHVEAAVAEARRQQLGLLVTGGATEIDTGNVPRAFDMRLAMTGLGNVVEIQPDDMTVTVQAGTTLARLDRALLKIGQRLPVDAALPEDATVGGIVAADSTGGLRYGYGRPRDLVLGMHVVDGKGRSYDVGGRVVKNVAGFDLVRLFTGSRGSLAVITELTLRTFPVAACRTTVLLPFEDVESLDRLRAEVFRSQLAPAAVDFAAETQGGMLGSRRWTWMMAAHLEGTEEQVAWQCTRLAEMSGREPVIDDGDWFSPAHADPEADLVVRLTLRPGKALGATHSVLAELDGRIAELFVGGHLGDGTVRFSARPGNRPQSEALVEAAERAATAAGGHVVLERAPLALKTGRDIWGRAPGALALMRELKKRFDPDGVLAPGRFVGGL